MENQLQSATVIDLSMLKCSSSEVVNSVFEDLGRVIDKAQGLKKLTVINFFD